jgi:CBS domain-containing protein
MKVREIMTTDVRACGPEANLADAAMIMWDNDCGVVPVVNGAGQPVGIITDRDICMAVVLRNQRATAIMVGEVSAGTIRSCQPNVDVRAALELMRHEQLRRLPVTDAEGRLVGILSLADIVRHAKKNEGKKDKYVSHRDVMRTLKALSKPGAAAEDEGEVAHVPAEVAAPATLDF